MSAPSQPGGKPFVLVLYCSSSSLRRLTTSDHLAAIRKYGRAHCVYFDVGAAPLPEWMGRIPWDLILFHDLLLGIRWAGAEEFERMCDRIAGLKAHPAVKIAVPQDEFYRADLLNMFVREFSVSHVFSVSPPSEWPKIYRDVDTARTRFHRVMTGYIEPRVVEVIRRIGNSQSGRSIDIGYRAAGRTWREAAWLGSHGLKKLTMAEAVRKAAGERNLKTDISTAAQGTLFGYDWYRFLLSCRFTIGVEGGASILDWDGSVKDRNFAYIAEHPDASFEDIEQACFPGRDGELALFALSPRHLECCVTRTCQILYEGEYDGVLSPGRHYIPLRHDHANLQEVLDAVQDEDLCREMTDTAYRDVVASRKYTYEAFASFLMAESLGEAAFAHTLRDRAVILPARAVAELLAVRRRLEILASGWFRKALRHAIQAGKWAVKLLPPRLRRRVETRLKSFVINHLG